MNLKVLMRKRLGRPSRPDPTLASRLSLRYSIKEGVRRRMVGIIRPEFFRVVINTLQFGTKVPKIKNKYRNLIKYKSLSKKYHNQKIETNSITFSPQYKLIVIQKITTKQIVFTTPLVASGICLLVLNWILD